MVKLSLWERIVVLVAAVFLAFTAGWVLRGRSWTGPLRVESQRRLEVAVTAFPAPTAEIREKVNINTADAETLATLPGIGEKRAADIVADREANGPYTFPEQITRIKGIGEETVAELAGYITVGEVDP